MDKFTAIKLWKKRMPIFDSLNTNVLFHQLIKKKSTDCVIIQQEQLTRANRKDYLKLLFEKHLGGGISQ